MSEFPISSGFFSPSMMKISEEQKVIKREITTIAQISKNVTDSDITGLDLVTQQMSNKLFCMLGNALEKKNSLSLKADKITVRFIDDTTSTINTIRDRIFAHVTSTEKAVTAKTRIIDELDRELRMLSLIKRISDDSFSPLEWSEDREFFVNFSAYYEVIKLFRSKVFNKQVDWDNFKLNPKNHPEWRIFKNEMIKRVGDPSKVEEIWNLTIKGICFQKELNKAGRKKENNPHFEELAMFMGREGLLSTPPDQPSALWSGGIDMSLYAQHEGYTTLEKTKAGQIYNTLMLDSSWEALGPLWNNLSREFVRHCSEEVHVFFRVQDLSSVLERQELKEIHSSSSVKKLTFHPVISLGHEIDPLDLVTLPVTGNKDPRVQLKDALTSICQKAMKAESDTDHVQAYKANLRAIKKMKLD